MTRTPIVTKRDNEIFEDYAAIMEELNDVEDEENYLREAYQGRWDRDSNE